MRNEKPGGHGERSVAVGVVDMALHDLAAKVAGVPLHRWIADHYGDGGSDDSVFVYAAAATTRPARRWATCRTRCAASSTRATRWSR